MTSPIDREVAEKIAASRTILLVEDDDIDAEAVQRALSKAGLRNPFATACDGIAALEILAGESPHGEIAQPCIILLDINMPRMNGFDFLHEMRQRESMKGNVVFFLTTSGRERDREAAYGLQAAGYVMKDDLGGFAEMLARYCGVNEFP